MSLGILTAMQIIYATSNIVASLQYCKKLLKPNGKLLIVETTRDKMFAGFMLASLS